MLKRNSLCHCGSGKKYKKCCMEKDMKSRVEELNEKALEIKKDKIDKRYTDAIIKLGGELEELIENNQEFAELEENARDRMFDNIIVNNIASNRFFASYFSYDFGDDKYDAPAVYVLNNKKFTEDERKIIYGCVYSYPSLFVIERITGKRVDIKDLFTQKIYNTLDSRILDGFKVGDYLLARPIRIDDIFVLIDLTLRIQDETKNFIFNTISKAYNDHSSSFRDIEDFVSSNSLFFYKNMLQLLKISDYKDEKLEECLHDFEDEKDEIEVEEAEHVLDETKVLKKLIDENIEDEDTKSGIMNLWFKVSDDVNITGSESGWAAGFEYNYRKSNGENVTQGSVAKLYGVSVSTLAKRNKEISAVINNGL